MHHVGPHLAEQPVDELVELLALVALFAAKHRDGHVAQLGGFDADAAAGNQSQQGRVVEPAVEPPRRVAEQRNLLLQVSVDAAEEHARLADVALIGADRRVDGDEHHVLAQLRAAQRPACCRAGNFRSTSPRRRRRDKRCAWGEDVKTSRSFLTQSPGCLASSGSALGSSGGSSRSMRSRNGSRSSKISPHWPSNTRPISSRSARRGGAETPSRTCRRGTRPSKTRAPVCERSSSACRTARPTGRAPRPRYRPCEVPR